MLEAMKKDKGASVLRACRVGLLYRTDTWRSNTNPTYARGLGHFTAFGHVCTVCKKHLNFLLKKIINNNLNYRCVTLRH